MKVDDGDAMSDEKTEISVHDDDIGEDSMEEKADDFMNNDQSEWPLSDNDDKMDNDD